MLKVRLLLGLLIAGLSTGLVLVWQNWGLEIRRIETLLFVILSVLVLPAIVLFLATFSNLKEGKIFRNSWLYKLSTLFSSKKSETEELRLCPSYWSLVLVMVFIVYTGLVLRAISSIVVNVVTGEFSYSISISTNDLMWSIGIGILLLLAISAVSMLIGLILSLIIKLWPRIRKTFIGQLIVALYDNACVKFQIEPSVSEN